MLIAVISDIHANVQALEAVIADAKARGVDNFICLGDIVGYGASPRESLELVRATCSVVLAGNHDDAVSWRLQLDDFVPEARDSVLRHRSALTRADIAYLSSLPYTFQAAGSDPQLAFSHADFVDPPKFYYTSDTNDAAANFAARSEQILFVGHTHVPELFVTGESGNVYRLDAQDFTFEQGKRYIVSVGSVGYPRATNGFCESSYVIYDDESRSVTFHTVPFRLSSLLDNKPVRNRGRMLLFALFAVVLAVFAVLFLVRTDSAAPSEPTVQPAPQLSPADSSVTNLTLSVSSSAASFRPNLKLAATSAPARVMMVFRTADGSTLKMEEKLVKRSFAAKYALPKGTDSVFVSVDKVDGDVSILSFTPEFTN